MKEESKKAVFYTHAPVANGAKRVADHLRVSTERYAGLVGFLFDDEPSPAEVPGMANYRITVEKVEEEEESK